MVEMGVKGLVHIIEKIINLKFRMVGLEAMVVMFTSQPVQESQASTTSAEPISKATTENKVKAHREMVQMEQIALSPYQSVQKYMKLLIVRE